MRTPALMVLGTGSHVGKSVLTAGLCRLFRQQGLRVAPFKAQNMSLNSAAAEGGEIGRAQAVQAAACGLRPSVDMNPVLLKPTSAGRCQLIVRGRPRGTIASSDHGCYSSEVIEAIVASYQRLAATVDLMVLEGAGSAAEINLLDRDVANLWMAERADAACLLVADIERGGAFAALYGTWTLAPNHHRIQGFVLNKFRGEPPLLATGIERIQKMTGVPTLAVLPFFEPNHGPCLPEEDSLGLPPLVSGAEAFGDAASGELRVGVLRFPHLANFTDFDPLRNEPGVALRYIWSPEAIADADVLILPGTKATVADLETLRANGLDVALRRAVKLGTPLLGICGGYQMLGSRISDPEHVEGTCADAAGLNLLPVRTVFVPDKLVGRVHGHVVGTQIPVEGYEIHHGRVMRHGGAAWFQLMLDPDQLEGCMLDRVWGSSFHGLFDADEFRAYALAAWRQWTGRPVARACAERNERAFCSLDARLDHWAEFLRPHFDVGSLLALARQPSAAAGGQGASRA
ncbi:MAG: cobyric acid synthase [Terriglobales bacterium]